MNNLIDIKSFKFCDLENFITSIGEKSFRAKQIFSWLSKGADSFSEMSDISNELREKFDEKCFINKLEIEKKLVSKIDKTTKYLYKLRDGNLIESVVMFYRHGASVCISTQVGCKMGCGFCASAQGGFTRNLTPAEILDQIIAAQKDLNIRISNIVIMGIGEPLDNFENLVDFLNIVNDKNGLNIGYRHITVSTCGLIDKIERLRGLNLPLTLSVSLHAPNDEIRKGIMPAAGKYGYDDLIAACRKYAASTKRRVTFEYALIDGINDSKQCARELALKIRGMLCHVNLIPANPVEGGKFKKSGADRVEIFKKTLEENNIQVTLRRTLGADIFASCGQLKAELIK